MRQSPLITVMTLGSDILEVVNQAIIKTAEHHEICGFLLGCHEQFVAKITHVYQVRNGVARNGGFSISRSEKNRTLRFAKKSGMEICAIFHTHSNGQAMLSETDRIWLRQSNYPWVLFTYIENKESAGIQVSAFRPENEETLTLLVE